MGGPLHTQRYPTRRVLAPDPLEADYHSKVREGQRDSGTVTAGPDTMTRWAAVLHFCPPAQLRWDAATFSEKETIKPRPSRRTR
jgi:hypothetical protein